MSGCIRDTATMTKANMYSLENKTQFHCLNCIVFSFQCTNWHQVEHGNVLTHRWNGFTQKWVWCLTIRQIQVKINNCNTDSLPMIRFPNRPQISAGVFTAWHKLYCVNAVAVTGSYPSSVNVSVWQNFTHNCQLLQRKCEINVQSAEFLLKCVLVTLQQTSHFVLLREHKILVQNFLPLPRKIQIGAHHTQSQYQLVQLLWWHAALLKVPTCLVLGSARKPEK